MTSSPDPLGKDGGGLVKSDGEIRAHYHTFMVYLACLSTAASGINRLYSMLGESKEMLGGLAQIFRRLDVLLNRWSYEQKEATSLMASLIKEPNLKSFLTRLSQALGIGIPLKDFIEAEYSKYRLTSQVEHQRMLDKLKGLSDAYSGILMAGTVISVSMMITSRLFGTGSSEDVLLTTVILVLAAIAALLFMIRLNSPSMPLTNKLPKRPSRIEQLERLGRPSVVVALMVSLFPSLLQYLGTSSTPAGGPLAFLLPIPLPFILAGSLLLALSLVGTGALSAVMARDTYFPVFIKTLGDASSLAGSLQEGLKRVVQNDYGPLNELVAKLHRRIGLGVESKVAWSLFMANSGSELIRRYATIYTKAIEVGAKADHVARVVYDASSEETTRRRQKRQVANYLKGLVFPAQMTMVAVITLAQSLLKIFNRFAELSSSYLDLFAIEEGASLGLSMALLFLALSLGNSLALYLIQGDSIHTLLSNLGLLLLLSGIINLFVSLMADQILGLFSSLAEGLSAP